MPGVPAAHRQAVAEADDGARTIRELRRPRQRRRRVHGSGLPRSGLSALRQVADAERDGELPSCRLWRADAAHQRLLRRKGRQRARRVAVAERGAVPSRTALVHVASGRAECELGLHHLCLEPQPLAGLRRLGHISGRRVHATEDERRLVAVAAEGRRHHRRRGERVAIVPHRRSRHHLRRGRHGHRGGGRHGAALEAQRAA
mmetsp:Transcript_27000/g.77324  ORF Transcript_27000/g.77324 Transcript_27000/m.77324 type:complete len:202 (-) Transcript_27000:660-1265(-)